MDRPIAITSMAGVFPGATGPTGVDGYWDNVKAARKARLQSLERKWGIPRSAYYDPNPGAPYKTYLDCAYTVADDPVSRQVEMGGEVVADLLRSVAHTALPAAPRTGLCVASLWTDARYFTEDASQVVHGISSRATRRPYGPGEQVAEVARAAGIAGPSLAVDTACASSLYAVDAAIGLLETGRADAVAVLGLNAFLPIFLYLGFAKLTALSPKAEIMPFSAEASGIIPSEAVAAVLVEPLDQAVRAGRPVLAVIRGLGLSADGGDRSVFAPSPRGQQLAYERAYRNLDPAAVDYVEAHGTATIIGDRTELDTLDQFFAPSRAKTKIPIGSAKALIGHTLATAGMVSLIKALCMMRDGVVPPHIRVKPNPRLAESCLRLPKAAEPWPESRHERRVAISSFGLGGANAHLVLGQAEPGEVQRAARRTFPAMAILAVEATFGEAHGIAAAANLLSASEPASRTFPAQRFSSQPGLPVEGVFFPGELPMESAGLRMGPRQLARLDPFQRLAIHTSQRVLERSNTDLEETAVVVCSDLGGAEGLQLARHYEAHFSGKLDAREPWARREPSLEGIASSLASLASGFVAFHHGLKGFHELVSGGNRTFWNALQLAPYWLGSRCSTLALGAGRHVNSPLDLATAGVMPGEGFGAILLASEAEAKRRGERPLAVIRSICSEYPENAELVEVCQLSSHAPLEGTAQRVCGFLGEAAGIEALLRVLALPGCGRRAVEFREGSAVLGWVVIEKLREVPREELSLRSPLPVEFQPPPSAPDANSPEARSNAAVHFTAWQQSAEAAVVSFLAAQQKLAAMLPATRDMRPPAPVPHRRTPVIADALTDRSGSLCARLMVDETHPYFFDHPLDHVPGILIVAGILQAVETLMPAGRFIRWLELKFTRFCEKNTPALIRVQSAGADSYVVKVVQEGAEVASCHVGAAMAPAMSNPAAAPRPGGIPADYRLLHKHHSDNVLVTQMEEIEPSEFCACDLLAPSADHILSEGAGSGYSMLYLLEAARQFLMQVAHLVEKIPLGMPMNLAGIRLSIDEPVPRGEALRFHCRRQPVQRLGHMTIANIAFDLLAGRRKIGQTAIKAQVVDVETYKKQRGSRAETGGRA